MKKILIMSCCIASVFNSPAQVSTIPNPKKQEELAAGKKKILEAAAIEKKLNAVLTNVKFNIYNDKPSSGFFKSRIITLRGQGANKFSLLGRKLESFVYYNTTANGKNSWAFGTATGEADKAGNGGMKADTYQSFLKNGFSVTVLFSNRAERIAGQEFSTNLSIDFMFSDGTTVEVPLQGLTYGIKPKGSFTAAPGKDFILNKSFAGSEFPDPNNPVTTAVIK